MRYRPITRNNDFNRAYRRGTAQVHPHVVLYACKNRCGHTRVGITASKKIGGAVTRNRARRVIRHALYQVLPQNIGGYDLVLVARGQTPHLKSTQVAATLRKLLQRAKLPLQPQAPVPAKKGKTNPDKMPNKSANKPANKSANNPGKTP